MTLSSGSRKLALTVHVAVSVGLIGAIACFFALSLAGVASPDIESVRSAYRAMQLATWTVIVPLAFASLVSGIVSSLGTNWGMLRHYWVLFKLIMTVVATAVLLIHTQPVDILAQHARMGDRFTGLEDQQWMMVNASAAAIVALVILTVLSVYKPQGLTGFGALKRVDGANARPLRRE
jgi:hypothetical protein